MDNPISALEPPAAGAENSLLNRVIDNLFAFVGVLTPDGVLTEVNRAALRAVGKTRDELLGKRFTQTPWWTHSIEAQNRLEVAIGKGARGESDRFEVTHRLVGGREITVDFMLAPVFDENRKVEFLVASSTDITNLVMREKALKKAEADALAANQSRMLFLANMSHELRTPLGVITGFAEMLTDPDLSSSEREQFSRTIIQNSQQLTQLINDILDLSKIEFNRMEIEHIEFSPADLISGVVNQLLPKARQKGLDLRLSSIGAMPDKIKSDPLRVRQVLSNVIGNAVKFTAAGSISVSCRCLNGGTEPVLEFEITDSGAGLTDEQKAKIFQPFTQGDSSMTRRYGGTGLGLYLSRRIARELGGDLHLVRSEPGVGSTFRFTIKGEKVDSKGQMIGAKECRASTSLCAQDEAPVRILVVDDSLDNQMLVSRILQRHGAQVDTASNGVEAVDKALSKKFDVVLMDLQMPIMNGYDALQTLKAKGYTGPILALTAHAMKEETDRCLRAGFNAHLAKPINTTHLLETICRFARRGESSSSN